MSGRRSYRVLVTGSRDWTDYAVIWDALNGVLEAATLPLVVVHGQCPTGADALASRWARANAAINWPVVSEEPHPADWEAHPKAARPLRNQEMVALGADVCLAFFKVGAGNRGTANCVRLAEAAGIPVRRFTA